MRKGEVFLLLRILSYRVSNTQAHHIIISERDEIEYRSPIKDPVNGRRTPFPAPVCPVNK